MAIIERKKQNKFESQQNRHIIKLFRDNELYFSNGLLDEITELYNEGHEIEDIAETFNRPVIEIMLALLYQAMQEKVTRPFAYRRTK
ncbi:hypothetical protein [Ornithinibacillus bavariensis]|uniref:hypothetical protein n=1 Tax=Ornithinibacillus bavariensis TaxID=545502 RepID=UPI000ED03B0C|nr:hypothetical protein [Ornithinibacillus sp.]